MAWTAAGRRAASPTSSPARAPSPSTSTTRRPRSSPRTGADWPRRASSGSSRTSPIRGYAALNSGKYATWLTAAWGPVFLSGSAKSTSGKWRAAPLPQWDASTPQSGNWGGSTSAVITSTKNPIAAAVFAQFLNTDPDSTKLFATKQFLFPATKALLADPAYVGDTPAFYGGQKVNEIFAGISSTVNTTFQWPPFLDRVEADFKETVGKSLTDNTDAVTALDQWQTRITTFAKGQGFTVQ